MLAIPHPIGGLSSPVSMSPCKGVSTFTGMCSRPERAVGSPPACLFGEARVSCDGMVMLGAGGVCQLDSLSSQ